MINFTSHNNHLPYNHVIIVVKDVGFCSRKKMVTIVEVQRDVEIYKDDGYYKRAKGIVGKIN